MCYSITDSGSEREIKLMDLKALRSNELGMTSTVMRLSTFAWGEETESFFGNLTLLCVCVCVCVCVYFFFIIICIFEHFFCIESGKKIMSLMVSMQLLKLERSLSEVSLWR